LKKSFKLTWKRRILITVCFWNPSELYCYILAIHVYNRPKLRNKFYISFYICQIYMCRTWITYSTIETKEDQAFTSVRMRKMKSVISNTGSFFCFNSTVSNLYNNDVIIHEIKNGRENSCEWIYLISLLQHW
jgi:hypothetical protein